ncbi:MAG: serine/threonine-protein kinase, partial [Planctomycetota bacterium]
MPNKPRAGDAAAFLQAAVRENMLSPGGAKELAAQAAASDKPIAELCVSLGRLTAIQADAIDGLVNPASVADGFQVEGLLGHGAIGIVYRALQPSLSRTVALKTIRASRLAGKDGSSGKAAARFRQEAVAIAKLAHPNIVTAYDYGARDDRLFLAMEMVDGVDLESLISTAGRLDESTAWRLAQQVAAALAHAHELGVVHRDIKPANLLLTEAPAGYPLPPGVPLVKVTDFGLARLMGAVGDEHTTRLTLDGATMGTPHYMAPEQVEDADVGFQADIYALGATVFHLISGKPPFAGRTVMKVFAAKMGGEEADLDSLPEDISQAGRELLASMLAYRPADRPASYGALLSQLREVIGGESGTSTTLGTTLSSVVKASAGGRLSMQPTQLVDATRGGSKSPQKAWRWVAAALCVGGLAIAAAVGPAAVPGAGAPPERQYELDATGGGLAPLFNGVDVFGWTGRGASPA